MFFTDREKDIYQPPGELPAMDPLAIERALVIHSNNQYGRWVRDHNMAVGSDGLGPEGDVSEEGKAATFVAAARAQGMLALLARKVFNLPDFPKCTDAAALEVLFHYWAWMDEKKTPSNPTPQ